MSLGAVDEPGYYFGAQFPSFFVLKLSPAIGQSNGRSIVDLTTRLTAEIL